MELLSAYIDQSLAPDQRTSVEAHLVKCMLCRKTLALAIKTQRAVPDPLPSDLTGCN
jgi:anti-sigma factor RsiW